MKLQKGHMLSVTKVINYIISWDLHNSVRWWSFNGFWKTTSLLRSLGFFWVFKGILIMLWSGWSWFCLWYPLFLLLLLLLLLLFTLLIRYLRLRFEQIYHYILSVLLNLSLLQTTQVPFCTFRIFVNIKEDVIFGKKERKKEKVCWNERIGQRDKIKKVKV